MVGPDLSSRRSWIARTKCRRASAPPRKTVHKRPSTVSHVEIISAGGQPGRPDDRLRRPALSLTATRARPAVPPAGSRDIVGGGRVPGHRELVTPADLFEAVGEATLDLLEALLVGCLGAQGQCTRTRL